MAKQNSPPTDLTPGVVSPPSPQPVICTSTDIRMYSDHLLSTLIHSRLLRVNRSPKVVSWSISVVVYGVSWDRCPTSLSYWALTYRIE